MSRGTTAFALALGVAASSCTCAEAARPPEKSSLRVPLPDGWKASALTGGLQVGPDGRTVLQLESTTRPFPAAQEFVTAVEGQGVEVEEKEFVENFLGVRYSVEFEGGKRAAFLGVRQTGPRTIWCSTTSSARPEEIEAAMTVCRSLSWEG